MVRFIRQAKTLGLFLSDILDRDDFRDVLADGGTAADAGQPGNGGRSGVCYEITFVIWQDCLQLHDASWAVSMSEVACTDVRSSLHKTK